MGSSVATAAASCGCVVLVMAACSDVPFSDEVLGPNIDPARSVEAGTGAIESNPTDSLTLLRVTTHADVDDSAAIDAPTGDSGTSFN